MTVTYTDGTNPYQPSAVPVEGQPQRPNSLNGITFAVCIVFLIFGVLGILGGIAGTAALFIGQAIVGSLADQNADMKSTAQQMSIAFHPIGLLLMALSLLASIAMAVGGGMGMARKLTGAKLIRNTALFLVFFKIAESLWGVYVQMQNMPIARKQFEDQLAKTPNADPKLGSFIDALMYGGMALGFCIVLAFVVFYVFCFVHMGKQSTLAQFK